MAPNLRPTLSTRIRASFDGKGSKANVQSPQETKTFIVQDAAVLRDAIGQAINNDSFQNAIAAHLAQLIEPSIKEALDTIQPVVETVYQHDILLRKTNRSVEDLLQRFDSAAEKGDDVHGSDTVAGGSKDFTGVGEIRKLLTEHKTHNDARFSELSSSVRRGQGTTSQAVTDIAEIKAALSLSTKILESLKSTAQQSTTDTFKLQEQLDELKTDIGKVMKSMETQSTTLIRIKEADLATAEILGAVQESHASHTVALSEIKAQDQSFKSASVPIFEKTHADTATAFQTLTSNLASLKESIKASFASENETISSLRSKLDPLLSSIDDIHGTSTNQEILAGVRKSNDFHTAHSTALESLKGILVTKEPKDIISTEHNSLPVLTEHLNAITTALDSHTSSLSALQRRADPEFRLNNIATTLDSHTGHLTTIKESEKSTDVLAAIRSGNEAYANHIKKLDEIKAVVEAANVSHVSNAADIGEIKALTKAAEESHKAHTVDLGEMKTAIAEARDSHTSHTKVLGELKSAVTAGNDSHATHTNALEAIKAANENAAQGTSSQSRSLEALKTQMGTVIATLGSQSIVHSDIRDAVHASKEAHSSHSVDLGEIRSTVKAASDSHVSHASTLEAIKAANETVSGTIAAQAESLASLETRIGNLNTDLQAQSSVHSEIHDAVRNSQSSHATALDGILSAHAATDTQIVAQTTALEAMGVQLGTIATDINHQNKTHSEIRDALQGSNASHASHAAALEKAETAHMDILGGLNGSKELLVGHGEVLASHTAMLEDVKETHSKTHEDAMGHISALENTIDAHRSILKDLQAETKDSYAQIGDSVKALGNGVHLNDQGLGQLREHTARAGYQNTEEIVTENAEPASKNVGAVTDHSFVSSKSALGIGMAAITGGGLMAVAGKEGLFSYGEENAREAHTDEPTIDEPFAIKGAHEVKEVEEAKSAEVDEPFREAEPSQADEPVTEELAAEEHQVHEEPAQASESVEDVGPSVNEPATVAESVHKPEKAIELAHEAEPVHHSRLSVEESPIGEVPVEEQFVATTPMGPATTKFKDVEPSKQVEESKPTSEHSQIQEVEPATSEPLHDELGKKDVISEAEPIQDLSTGPELVSEGPGVQDIAIDEPVTQYASELAAEEPVTEHVSEPASEELAKENVSEPAIHEDFHEPAVEEPATRGPATKVPAQEPIVAESAVKEPVLDEAVVEEPIPNEPVHDLELLNEVKSTHDALVDKEEFTQADHIQADDSTNAAEPIMNAEPTAAVESAVDEPAYVLEPGKDEPSPVIDTARAVEPVQENNSALKPEPVNVLGSEAGPLHEAEPATQEPITKSEPLYKQNTTETHSAPESEPAHEVESTLDHSIVDEATIEEPVSKTENSEEQLIHEPVTEREQFHSEPRQMTDAGRVEVKSASDVHDKEESPANILVHETEAGALIEPVFSGEIAYKAEALREIEPGKDVGSHIGEVVPGVEPVTAVSILEEPVVEPEPPASELIMESEPAIIANSTKESPAEHVEPSTEGSSFGQAESLPMHGDKAITGESSAQVTPVQEVKSLPEAGPVAGAKPASEIEPTLEEPALVEPAPDGSTAVEPTTTYRDILTELTAGEPAIEPIVAESSREVPAEEFEPRPALTKRVSFKDPLIEVKQAPEPNLVAEEAIEEDQLTEVEQDRVDPAAEKLPRKAELNTPETGPIQERQLVDESSAKLLPVREESPTEIEPSKQAAESSAGEKANSETNHDAEAEPSAEAKSGPEEPVVEKSIGEKPALESSVGDINGATHSEKKPNMENELAPEPVSDREPANEIGDSATGLLGEIKPAEEVNRGEDQQATHDVAHSQITDKLEPEESALEEPVAESKDNMEELPIGKSVVDKIATEETTAKPADGSIAEVPVEHNTVVHEPVLEQPASKEATTEEVTTNELSGKRESAIKDTGIKGSLTESKAAVAEPAIKEPIIHEPIVGSVALNELSVGKPVTKEPVMHESGLEESVADEKGVDKSTMENPITEFQEDETNTTVRELPTEKSLVEDSTIKGPTAASVLVVEGTHLEAEPHKDEVPLSKEVVNEPEDESAVEEPVLEDPAQKEEVSAVENPSIIAETIGGEPVSENPALEDSTVDQMNGNKALHELTVRESAIVAEPVENKMILDEQSAKEPAIKNEMAVEKEEKPASDGKLFEDIRPLTATDNALEESNKPAEVRSEIESNAAMSGAETERQGETIHAQKDEPSTEIKSAPETDTIKASSAVEGPLVHDPTFQTHEPVIHEQLQDKQVVDERIAERTAPEHEIEDSIHRSPTKTAPTRVDSGIEVDTPTDIKSAVDAAPLRAVAEDPAAWDNSIDVPTGGSTMKEPTVQGLTLEEPATETKPHSEKPTIDEPVAEANLAPERETGELHGTTPEKTEKDTTVQEAVENGHSSHAVDAKGVGNELVPKAESTHENPLSKLKHVMENLFHKAPVNGDTVENTPAEGEPTTETHAAKDLHVEAKPATKEQHTRVDSGIDIETPRREASGKLEPVVEIKPAPEVDAGLEGEAT